MDVRLEAWRREMERQTYRALRLGLRESFDHRVRHWREQRWVQEVRVEYNAFQCHTELRVQLCNVGPDQGAILGHIFTDDELDMGGRVGFEQWLDRVEIDIRHHIERAAEQRRSAPRAAQPQLDWPDWDNTNIIIRYGGGYGGGVPDRVLVGQLMMAEDDRRRTERENAEARARELFERVAGRPAFEALEAGKTWPLTGSAGTQYLLHRKASFCIERPSDGAQLCAVVPGVPLYDHLLGIKLMVETDEPRFLEVANVSGVWRDAAYSRQSDQWMVQFQREYIRAVEEQIAMHVATIAPVTFIGFDPAA